ncbi:MAG: MobF family relaxase [Acidimicrobiales bacterium]|jgi:conjugative relaxase-like TrwC/TraI family protein
MLSIGRLGTTGGAEYYLDKVANNVDDYYLGRGEAPGQWIGATSERLGLVGQVGPEALRNLLAGKSPSGDDLGARLCEERRPGYDLTFSAPKGISLLWAFGPGDVRDAISVAHDHAVGAVLDHLSTEACYARRGAGGRQLVEANGFIGAAFRHRTSRAGDPQLHTHVVVPNLVHGADGQWSAPDGRHLFTWKMTAGTLYRSALRAELAPLGLAWHVRRNGLSELRDIPKTILRAFSKRRIDIEAAMEQRGCTSAAAAAKAALATRQRKPAGTTPADLLREGWLEQLAEIELPDGQGGTRQASVDDLTAALGNDPSIPSGPKTTEAILRVLAGENGVSLDDWEIDEHLAPDTRALPVTLLGSTFTRRDAICAVARAFDVTPHQALALTSKLLDRDSVVRVLADPTADTDYVRTRSGQLVPATSGDRRYTTTELLAAEQRITRSAVARIEEGTGRVASGTVDQVLGSYAHLDGEQADGVRALLTSGNGYDLVIGQAGTGKSTMLHAARVGWEEAGFKVIGTAVAARTAAELEAGTGIPSSSLTQLLADLRKAGGLTSRHVIVVDEASMVGSRPLDRLRSHVDVAGAKLVLVGDNRQLSSIDAGGALRSMSNELGSHVVTLTTNRRQGASDQQWERDALVALRDGNIVPAVHAYVEHGKVTITGTIDEARHRLIEDWWGVHRDRTTAILAVRRVDVVALNDMVRSRRQAAGELGEEIRLDGRAFSIGDRVVFEKNQRVAEAGKANRAGRPSMVQIRNGTFGTVVGVIDPFGNLVTREGDVLRTQGDVQGDVLRTQGDVLRNQGDVAGNDELGARAAALVVELADGRRGVLPRSYAESSTSLGYALTVFRSQGITVDHTFGLGGDSLFQEAGYTQLSRGRLSNNLYVAAPENPRWEIGHAAEDITQRDALRSLADALSQSREQTMAIDRLPVWASLSPDDLDATYRQHATLGRWLTDHAPADVTDQLAAAYDRTRHTEATGRDAHDALEDLSALAATQRRRNEWVAHHGDEITTWSRLDRAVRRNEYRLGQAASYSQPEHVTALLGPLPERITEVERWQAAAGAIEAYRTRWNITGTASIGPEPNDPEQRSQWDKTVATVGAGGFLTSVEACGVGTEREVLATRWENIHALDRQRDDDRSVARTPVLSPESRWPDEPDLDRGFDYGLGM